MSATMNGDVGLDAVEHGDRSASDDREHGRALRAEAQLAIAQAITHIGSWEWDARTRSVAWSDELYRIYGLEPRSCEVTFDWFLSRLVPADRDRIRAAVFRAFERGERFTYGERIVRPDGTIRHLETMGEPTRDGRGAVVGLIGTCRDVTDRVHQDEELRTYADIVGNVNLGLSVWSVADPDDADGVRLVAHNPALERIEGRPLASFVGRPFHEVAPYANGGKGGGKVETLLRNVARDGEPRQETVSASRDAPHAPRWLAIKGFPLPGQRVGLAVDDVTKPMLVRQMQAAEQRIFEMIAKGEPLGAILASIVLAIEAQSPATIASVLLLDPEGRLRHGAAPSLPRSFIDAIDGSPIGPRAGSCGTAAFLHRPVQVPDIESDPRWVDYRDVARAAGLRACWSTPVVDTTGRVLGTFALYHRDPRSPTPEDLALIARATHIAGLAIERRNLEDELRALSVHIESVREQERTGIAREIHDELGQSLTAFKMDLAWIARRATSDAGLSREALLEKLAAMSSMTDEVIDQVRRISAQLRPGVLDDLGLAAAVEWQAQEFERRTGATCIVRSTLTDDVAIGRDLATALFRIFQEALTNVARHGEATRVEVRLERIDGGAGDRSRGAVRLEVEDDGKGIAAEAIGDPRSLGLIGMRERARSLGGTAVIGPKATRGTVVSVQVPLTLAAPAAPPSPAAASSSGS